MQMQQNDRLEELFLLIGDRFALVNKIWWYILGIVLVAAIPAYFIFKAMFVKTMILSYHQPQMVYLAVEKQPLQILDKKVFSLGNNSYTGYVKIKNINLEWGVGNQGYTAEFKTFGGTSLRTVTGQTYVLPASEKLLVFSRFTSQQKPDVIEVSLSDPHFIHKPDIEFNFELERINTQNNPNGLIVSAGIKNLTALTIKQINLPVIVYNNKNEIVAVNFTNINDVLSGETRTFRYTWPEGVFGAVRAEIGPEINVFDRNIFSNQIGVQPFENQ